MIAWVEHAHERAEVDVHSYRGAPTLSEEIRAWRSGHRHVAGVDEVGRGPMAGPVVAGAVILDPQFAQPWWSELRDSKLLTAARRADLDARIRESACFGIGSATHAEIDAHGLIEATRQAMLRALAVLPQRPGLILIDAVSLPEGGDHVPIIHGDTLSGSIAAASIIAKVERDRLMDGYDGQYPGYGFAHNRGYCTADHLRALEERGPCAIHRRSFAPVRAWLEGRQQKLSL
jgi:ribonuclease HII